MNTASIPAGAVVVGVDGSQHAEHALVWAADVAAREHRPLVLAHSLGVANPYWLAQSGVDVHALTESIRSSGAELVDGITERLKTGHPELDVRSVIIAMDARDLLIDLSENAHLVVVGSRGRGAVRSLLLGSVSAAVSRHAHCPVVVLRRSTETGHGGGVLVGVDGTDASLPTLEFAFRAASWQQARLTVVHCFWDAAATVGPGLVPATHPDYAEERLAVSESLAGLYDKYPDVEVTVELARGLVDQILLEMTRDKDLVVVGTRPHGALADMVLGSVATTLVEHAHCPVAVVPHQQPDEG